MAMTLDELRKAFHEAMPGPRKGDLVDMMTKTRPISTVVESPGRVFTADKLGSKVISQFESHEDFSVLKSTTKADPNKPPPSYNAVCLKHPETGEIKFAYDQTLELQLINKLFNGQSRIGQKTKQYNNTYPGTHTPIFSTHLADRSLHAMEKSLKQKSTTSTMPSISPENFVNSKALKAFLDGQEKLGKQATALSSQLKQVSAFMAQAKKAEADAKAKAKRDAIAQKKREREQKAKEREAAQALKKKLREQKLKEKARTKAKKMGLKEAADTTAKVKTTKVKTSSKTSPSAQPKRMQKKTKAKKPNAGKTQEKTKGRPKTKKAVDVMTTSSAEEEEELLLEELFTQPSEL